MVGNHRASRSSGMVYYGTSADIAHSGFDCEARVEAAAAMSGSTDAKDAKPSGG